jgi:hypothetical protein
MLLNARIEECSGNPDTSPSEMHLKDRVAFIRRKSIFDFAAHA